MSWLKPAPLRIHLPEDLAQKLALAARLRNLLVHRYWIIDDLKVYEAVKRGLEDFEDFTKIIKEVTNEAGA